MSYTQNPHLPRIRMEAVRLFHSGVSTRQVARHFGFNQSTIVRWVNRAPDDHRWLIETRSSRPHHHPATLPESVVSHIISLRHKTKRGPDFLHQLLLREGMIISLSSVKRVLRRYGEVNHSKWKKWHQSGLRPIPEKPGLLVEIDTIHDGPHTDRLYIYTLIDVYSRYAFAMPFENISNRTSIQAVKTAIKVFPFLIKTLQSDHGPEFEKYFRTMVKVHGINHRHSRVRQPNDNAHLERFNRTLQDECLSRSSRQLKSYRTSIKEYLHYYNTERPHQGLHWKTPSEILQVMPSY